MCSRSAGVGIAITAGIAAGVGITAAGIEDGIATAGEGDLALR
jgi:hypothetical protein